MRKQAEQWLLYARSDLETCRQLLDQEDLTNIVIFHAQQCVEKSFKALLELSDRNIPRIHDLRRLLQSISLLYPHVEIDQDTLDTLNQVYIDTRYPSDFGILPEGRPSSGTAKKLQQFADDVYQQAVSIFSNIKI